MNDIKTQPSSAASSQMEEHPQLSELLILNKKYWKKMNLDARDILSLRGTCRGFSKMPLRLAEARLSPHLLATAFRVRASEATLKELVSCAALYDVRIPYDAAFYAMATFRDYILWHSIGRSDQRPCAQALVNEREINIWLSCPPATICPRECRPFKPVFHTRWDSCVSEIELEEKGIPMPPPPSDRMTGKASKLQSLMKKTSGAWGR